MHAQRKIAVMIECCSHLLVGMPRTLETAAWVRAVHWVELIRERPSSSGIQRDEWVSMWKWYCVPHAIAP